MPYFEKKYNSVKRILALCSILWQGKRENMRLLKFITPHPELPARTESQDS